MAHSPYIGVDWGTTHRRAYALDAAGTCTQEASDDQGALTTRGRHAESLAAWLPTLTAAPTDTPVVMSGMVGSAFGWLEAPYLGPEVALEELPRHLVAVPGQPLRHIVPGYCVRNAQGQPDVMRGEETQLLGAVAMGLRDGWFVLPGTHSKWVLLQDGRIQQLRTYMTGELFALLSRHGTLAAAAGQAAADAVPLWQQPAFADGVAAGGPGALAHQLFACRARVVTGTMPAHQGQAYLSGLLIGSELQDVLRDLGRTPATASPFHLIGSPALAEAYQVAARQLGSGLTLLSPREVILRGFHYIQTHGA